MASPMRMAPAPREPPNSPLRDIESDPEGAHKRTSKVNHDKEVVHHPPGLETCEEGVGAHMEGVALLSDKLESGGKLAEKNKARNASVHARIGSAVLYGGSSILLVISNKLLLTNYGFPSFKIIALGQFVFTCAILQILQENGTIRFSDMQDFRGVLFDTSAAKAVLPLPFLFAGNVMCGLASTKTLNLAMFSALRRFSVLFTMLVEVHVLLLPGFSKHVRLSVWIMLLGGGIAALHDLDFDAMGYLAIMGNNVFTALYGGVSKSKLSGKPKDETPLTKFGLLYYNSLLSFPFMLAVVLLLEPAAFTATFTWFSMAGPWELTFFSFSLVMGVVLNYAVFLCTQLNSATTTCVTGSLKNILVAYASIFFMGNYTFDWTNFMGLNISMGGSLYYAWAKLTKK